MNGTVKSNSNIVCYGDSTGATQVTAFNISRRYDGVTLLCENFGETNNTLDIFLDVPNYQATGCLNCVMSGMNFCFSGTNSGNCSEASFTDCSSSSSGTYYPSYCTSSGNYSSWNDMSISTSTVATSLNVTCSGDCSTKVSGSSLIGSIPAKSMVSFNLENND